MRGRSEQLRLISLEPEAPRDLPAGIALARRTTHKEHKPDHEQQNNESEGPGTARATRPGLLLGGPPLEILGIAGLVGAGRTETLRVCFGLDRIKSGSVLVYSRESTRSSPARRLAEGIGLTSENRKEEGLMLNRRLADNMLITRYGPVS